MQRSFLSLLALTFAAPAVALAQAAPSTQPVALASAAGSGSVDTGILQVRANEAFAKGDYAAALPMLQVLSARMGDQPDALGPVLEQIRVCQRQLKGGANKTAVALASGAAGPADNLDATRTPHPLPKPGEVTTLAIKELGNFDYDSEKGGNVPADVVALSNHPIRTHGFMIPLDQAENIANFALVPSLFSCCFGQPPQVQHTLVVHCPKGQCVNYFPDELSVEGTLKVQEKKDGGFIVSLFDVDATSIKPMAK